MSALKSLFGWARGPSEAELRLHALMAQWDAHKHWLANSGREIVDDELAETVADIAEMPADSLLFSHTKELYMVFRPDPSVRLFCRLAPEMAPGVEMDDVPLPAYLYPPS